MPTFVTVSGIIMEVIGVFKNVLSPMVVKLLDKVIPVKAVQFEKELLPIVNTLFGIVRVPDILVQSLKTKSPKLNKRLGRDKLVKLVQF
jgi:hypothetical protein